MKLPLWQVLGASATFLGAVFIGVIYMLQWTVDRTVSGIDKQFSSIDRQIDDLSVSLKDKLVNLDDQVKNLDSTLDVVGDEVTKVASNIERAEQKTDTVEDDVVEARLKVEEIITGLDQTSAKVDSLKTVLNVAFKDDSNIKVLLDDDRLSEAMHQGFFEGEPSKGAALPVTAPLGGTSDNRLSIATYCSQSDLDTKVCYQRFLERYERLYGE